MKTRFKNRLRKRMKLFAAFSFSALAAAGVTGCTLGPLSSLTGSGGLQVYPSSTTVGVNQTMAFQVSGGTPPYTFQDYGLGSVSSSGAYQAGASTGQSQIQVTDSAGNSASAAVSIVQQASTNITAYAPQDAQALPDASLAQTPSISHGWAPTNTAENRKAPLVRGQIIGIEDKNLTDERESVHSQFIQTNLRHPVVRLDELKEGNRVIAVRAVTEDQFVVNLKPGYSEPDLSPILALGNARISRKLSTGSYLVSMSKQGEMIGSVISTDFITKRDQLKIALQQIAVVTPNFLTRTPSDSP